MISREMAKVLLPLINSETFEDLTTFVNSRIKELQGQLESSYDTNYMFRVQGSISELRNILRLRDFVNDHKDQ
jgi:hypothetical protein